ncbi:MAG: threonine--tRNA ligase [Eubacteriales bacterium]
MKIINHNGVIEDVSFDDHSGKEALRHTASHILAQAVKRLYPETKLAIGPAIKDGFYYDFDREHPFTEDELGLLEAEMKKIIKENLKLERFTLDRDKARALIEELGETYKTQLLDDIPDGEEVSFFRQGEFVDLCAGPHLTYTSGVKAFALLSIAGAYWRGSEKNKMLTRIYGTAFESKQSLADYLAMLEEAKRRDHRKLGKELGLFAIMEEGPGFPFFLPNGMIVKNELIDYWREIHRRDGYREIQTPILLTKKLWETSGHWEHYKSNIYTTSIDDTTFAVKPMNCPGGMLVYKSEPHSYKDLPLKLCELGLVHRHEKSGELHGLMRVRCFTQDDAHIFMVENQIQDQIKGVLNLVDEVYSLFGFKYHIELSTMPEDHMGDEKDWETATRDLVSALDGAGLPYIVNEGDGAFYGPKIDFHLEDSLGRTWQCGTIQLDFQMPQRFELEYTGADGQKHRPIMIHRVVYGSIERFIGILIEHFAGKFPVWLSPEQVRVLPITDKNNSYAEKVLRSLKDAGVRCDIDKRQEKTGYKIREAAIMKVPYILVIGEKEEESNTVTVRRRDSAELAVMDRGEFVEKIKREITQRQ